MIYVLFWQLACLSIYIYIYIYMGEDLCLDSSFFLFKNVPTPLCLSREKLEDNPIKI